MSSTVKNASWELFQSVLRQAALSIEHASQKINPQQVQSLLSLYEGLRATGGSLIFCGVGKSGLVAQKICATFVSLGMNCWFLHPTEALHGDMGRVMSNDVIAFLSKSGTTEEILKLMPYLPVTATQWIALVGDVNSQIAKNCNLVFDCSIAKEASLNNLAPTTSTSVTLAMGDAMAVLYESFVGLSKEGFAKNHPGGILGKSLLLKVQNLMMNKNQLAIVDEHAKIKDVILAMTQFPTGLCCIIQQQSNKLLGIIVEGDIRRHLAQDDNVLHWSVEKMMNKFPKTIHQDALAYEALKLMEDKNKMVYVLPVVNSREEVVGVIRLHDLLKEGFNSSST